MAEYEHLLSKDPIGAFDKIRDDYRRYFETMYRFKDTSLDKKKNDILLKDDNLLKEPYCELLPKYESTGKDLAELCDNVMGDYYLSHPGIRPLPILFADFVTGGLMDYKPYKHQFEMLCKGYGMGRDVLITSGTGSGKTESFMLPLLASLLAEAQAWTAPLCPYDASWWQKRDVEGKYQPCQRTDETRQSAIRALLLYPMNALVADQVGRLRKALDSDSVRTFLDNHCAGNRIFFGSYNGKTLKSGEIGKLEASAEQAAKLAASAASGSCEQDDVYVVPRLSDIAFTSEMLVREDMQEKSPDIMITNISMLSIMLMRAGEQKFLDDTRAYYENNPDAKFHLVVDELHLHRGTAGSEVAYLLRMFLERIGVPPMKNGVKNPQLQVYASSASLGSAQDYLEDFFGIINPFDIQVGYDLKPVVRPSISALDYQYFDTFYLNNPYSKPYYELDDAEKDVTEKVFMSKIGYAGAFKDFIDDYAPVIYNDLKGLITSAITTFPLSDLKKLSASASNEWIRGFLIFRGNVSHPILPSVRFHQFYRYIDGIWGELLPDSDPDGPIGEILYHPSEVSSSGQHKVLELLRCECCGELFIGGNRTDVSDGVRLSLNSPKLDVIPNSQATPMVQKKNIKEYAVFWPSHATPVKGGWYGGSDPLSPDYERFGVVNCVRGYTSREAGNDTCHGAWRFGYLNPSDGSIVFSLQPSMLPKKDSFISGYVYYPRTTQNTAQYVSEYDNFTLNALPCKCPACEKDYRKRHYTQSPIRSFRTGMGRNNQLLSKELLYQLEPIGEHQPKLIGFSDSRQDAAEQSKLIGREHYRDMLRLVFIKIISQKACGVLTPDLARLIKRLERDIMSNDPVNDILDEIEDAARVDTSDKHALKAIVLSGKPDVQIISELKAYSPKVALVDLNQMISKNPNMIDGELIAELLRLGINPSGAEYSDMYPTRSREYWDTFYDFTPRKEQLKPSAYTLICNPSGTVILGPKIYKNIESNIFKNCFGQYMNVNAEVAGLGCVASADISGISEVAALERELRTYLTVNGLNIQDVINAFIRIYGDNYRYDGDFDAEPMPNYSDFSSGLKKTVSKLAQLARLTDEKSLGKKIAAAMRAVATDPDGKLVLSKPLRFRLAHSGDAYYKCSCGRVHLHRGAGICTNTTCLKPLPKSPSGVVDDLWESNYISFDVKKEPHETKRLHSEELTGQTDDQITRLLCFKDIMLGDSSLLTNAIDMLCVTTTMEVGVDIGSLQAVYQGNMPPTRYNYQQRVGRAGRRNQAYSLALTFCRGRSHDTYYYYDATDRITGGTPAVPTLSVNPIVRGVINPVVLKRIILKHILMLFSAGRSDWAYPRGTIAQLGGRGYASWDNEIKKALQQWIAIGLRSGMIKDEIILYYTKQYVADSHPLNDMLLDWVRDEVLDQMSEAIRTTTQGDNALAIAEAGLLPMYGMPAASRNFYHNGYSETIRHAYSEHFTGVIDRPIEQSIIEFAPGAIKTKDAAEYQAAGLTVPLNEVCSLECTTLKILAEMEEQLDPLQYSFNLNMDGVEISSVQPYNPSVINPIDHSIVRLVVPKAYRSEKIFDNKGDYCQEDDSRSNYSPVSVWVDASSSSPIAFAGGSAKWEVWNGDNKKGDVWYINTNKGEFFRGWRAMKASADYTYEPRFFRHRLDNVSRSTVIKYAPNFMVEPFFKRKPDGPWETTGAPEVIAIGAKKITDILCLSFDPSCIPAVLNLNVKAGNRSAIIAAMYSAATLIQRAFADEIDIQPEEIEISEVKVNPINGLPSVYLNDKAANGAGYVSLLCKVTDPTTQKTKLQEIMEDIVSPAPKNSFVRALFAHKDTCSTACPKCLNTFYNSSLHHVLDWRLGVDIIKLMLDKTYDMGYSDLSATPYGDLAKTLNELGRRIQDAHPMGNVVYHPNDLTDWRTGYFETKSFKTTHVEHLVHPLWSVEAQNVKDGYIAQNSFNLQRAVKPLPKPCRLVAPAVAPVTPTPSAPSSPTSSTTTNSGTGGWGSLS